MYYWLVLTRLKNSNEWVCTQHVGKNCALEHYVRDTQMDNIADVKMLQLDVDKPSTIAVCYVSHYGKVL
jgi:hypothetical protein